MLTSWRLVLSLNRPSADHGAGLYLLDTLETKGSQTMRFGVQELLIILVIVILLFGASRIPKLAGSVGEAIKEFRKGVKKNEEDDAETAQDDSESDSEEA